MSLAVQLSPIVLCFALVTVCKYCFFLFVCFAFVLSFALFCFVSFVCLLSLFLVSYMCLVPSYSYILCFHTGSM